MKELEKKSAKHKVIFISGSPRKGNTDYILQQIYSLTLFSKDMVLLRDKKINHCKGCLGCHRQEKCVITDDMSIINQQLIDSELIIIGTPNYFDNVTGLLKDFIDRTHPLYKREVLKGKKVVFVMVGGGKPEGTKAVLSDALKGFIKYQKLDLVGSFSFQSLRVGEILEYPGLESEIKKIVSLVSTY